MNKVYVVEQEMPSGDYLNVTVAICSTLSAAKKALREHRQKQMDYEKKYEGQEGFIEWENDNWKIFEYNLYDDSSNFNELSIFQRKSDLHNC